MSMTPSPVEQESPDARRARRWSGLAWRLAATLVIVLGAIAVAGFLGNPQRFASKDTGGLWQKTPAPAEPSAEEEPKLSPDQKQVAAHDNLRRMLGGILLKAAENPSASDDPLAQPPEKVKQFLAEKFEVDPGYPRSEVPAGVVPAEAEVLFVFQHPEAREIRMVMVRLRTDVPSALAAFQALYGKDGWHAGEPEANRHTGGPGQETDKGWLVRYTRGRQMRFVFLEKREARDETLAMVYDTH